MQRPFKNSDIMDLLARQKELVQIAQQSQSELEALANEINIRVDESNAAKAAAQQQQQQQ